MSEKDDLNALTEKIISAAIAVHQALGPGMLESSYEACLTYELLDRGLSLERQKPLPIVYRGQTLDCGYRLDLLVEGQVGRRNQIRRAVRTRSRGATSLPSPLFKM
jgi:hypothetical protein